MQGLLRKKMWRELRAAWPRYLALGLTICLAMYLVVSLIGAADTVIVGTRRHARQNAIEDGQFTTFVPLTEAELEGLRAAGATVEPMFYRDIALADADVLRVFRVREQIDLAELERGALPASAGEILLEKRYCEANGLEVGDEITVAGQKLTLCGIATTPDYDTPFRTVSDSTVDSAGFGTAFVTDGLYEGLAGVPQAVASEEYLYAYRLNGALTDDEMKARVKALQFDPDRVEDPYFQDYWDQIWGDRDDLLDGVEDLADGTEELSDTLTDLSETLLGKRGTIYREMLPKKLVTDVTDLRQAGEDLAEGALELKDAVEELTEEYLKPDTDNLRTFMVSADNPRIGGAADDVIINKYASILAGVIIMALLTYVISVFVVHNIESEQSVIGTLYAMGVRRRELMEHYLLLPMLVSFLAGALGTAAGYSKFGVPLQTADTYAYFSVPTLQTVVSLPVIAYGAVMPPLVAALVNGLVIRKKLSAPALQMLRNETRRADTSRLDLKNMSYIRRFQLRQLLREGRSAVGVVLGIFICFLLMMIGINAWVLCDHVGLNNVADTRYEAMYLYKYPPEKCPSGAHPAYAVTMKKEVMGYNMDVTVLGLQPGDPFFDAAPPESMSRVQISSAMAQKYALKAGDVFTLNDEEDERVYAFTVDSVVRYAPAFYVFMDLDSMRDLFHMPDDYFNVVFADRELDVEAGRLYSVSTRRDVIRASGIFTDLMASMVYTMTGASAAIMGLVMYLMIKVMLDHSAGSIALFMIFGYRRQELKKLFLNGNTLLIALGALISIPLSKGLMDALYPYLVSNVACDIDLHFEPWLYAALFGGCMLLYGAMYALLTRRIYRIRPNEVLKRRE